MIVLKKTLKEIYNILEYRDRKKGYLLLVLMLFTATFDAAGVASLMPFIAIVSQPELVPNNNYLLPLYNIFLTIVITYL